MSTTDLTSRAAWIVALACVALLCAGWRKTARATPRPPRATGTGPAATGAASTRTAGAATGGAGTVGTGTGNAAASGIAGARRPRIVSSRRGGWQVMEVGTQYQHRTPLWRKVWSVASMGAIVLVLGAAVATVVGYTVAWAVITLTDLLKR